MNSPDDVLRLADRALVRVAGPDWRAFLQGLITQDVETLTAGELRYAALLTPQGRLLHELFVLGVDDGVLLDVAASQCDALIQRLAMYRLRAKVEITPSAEQVYVALPRLQGDGAAERPWPGAGHGHARASAAAQAAPPAEGSKGFAWVHDPRLPELGWRGYGELSAEAGDDAYDAHRLALGVPDPLRDCADDKTYPIEADFDLLNGIDFRKGCFVGQETTSRMKRRGAIRSRMVPIRFEGPPPAFGAELLAGDLRAGEVRSGRKGRAIALVRLDRVAQAALTAQGRPVQLDPPPWLAPEMQAPALAGTSS